MRFLVDAQLPRRLAAWLQGRGFDAVHTLDLPDRNLTTDAAIAALAVRERRVVITKDSDFINSFILQRQPEKLLLVSTGNITNVELESLLAPNLATIIAALEVADFVEFGRVGVIVHG